LVLLDPPVAASSELHRGQEHLIRARYDLAEAEFVGVFNAAEVQQNLRLQADAAGRVSWTLFEQGRYEESDKWFQTSIKLIETYFGTGLKEIIDSVQPGGRSAVLSRTDDTSYVLSRALQIRCRSLTQRLVYCQQYERYREAEEAFAHSLAVDRYLEVPALLGHDLRVYAVLVAAHDDRRHREAQKLFA
jgi:tetratricopeptide (TPR) repeat protein